ncbi:MAG: endo-1,4-beta-xylanase [Bacteroidota bacterium]
MKRTLLLILICFWPCYLAWFAGLSCFNGQTRNVESALLASTTNNNGLKAITNDFFIGIAVNPNRVADKTYSSIYSHEFNSITAENAMKMHSILIGLDANNQPVYDWTQSDAIVNFAEANQMNLHGHALIWHESIPEALKNFKGSDETFAEIIKTYITDVVTRYKGKVDSWDVVNEAIDDESALFRNSIFYQRLGKDYVKKCFELARAADNEVKLLYNDFNLVTKKKKRKAVFALVDELMAENLIDGVGYQMHINFDFPSKSQIQKAVYYATKRKLLVHFSELDVQVNANNDIETFTQVRTEGQKLKVKEVVEVYADLPKKCQYALTVWGLKDDDSWITPRFGHKDWPLLFDDTFRKKDAYYGFLDALNQKQNQ